MRSLHLGRFVSRAGAIRLTGSLGMRALLERCVLFTRNSERQMKCAPKIATMRALPTVLKCCFAADTIERLPSTLALEGLTTPQQKAEEREEWKESESGHCARTLP